jgi:phosphoglycolate phosphatase
MLKGLLFDKDGTLIDFDLTWGPAGYAVITQLANGRQDVFDRLIEASDYCVATQRFRPTSHIVAGSSAEYGSIWQNIVGHPDLAEFRVLMDRLFKDAARQSLAPIGDPLNILSGLKTSGYKIGIATNDSEYGAHEQAKALGLMPILDFIAGYDSGFGGKPDPGMVHGFARHCGLNESEIALIGDSTHDLHAARAAGAVAIAVLSGPASRAALEPHADYVIESILDLPDLVKDL